MPVRSIYLEWRNRSSQDADSHATWLIYLTTLLFAVLAIIFYVIAPEIIQVIGYGFQPKEKQLAVILERLLILLLFIDGAGILFRGILLARKMFFHLYVAPIFVNITIVFFLVYDIGLDIYALVWGFLIGTLIKTVYMGVALRKEKFQYGAPIPFDHQKMLIITDLGVDCIINRL